MMTTDAKAVNMDVVPSIRLEEGWDSNAFNSSTNEVSSFGTRLTPALALRFTSPDNVMLEFSGNYEIVRYHDSEAKEADYDTWYFRINSTGGWALTPTLSMRPVGVLPQHHQLLQPDPTGAFRRPGASAGYDNQLREHEYGGYSGRR